VGESLGEGAYGRGSLFKPLLFKGGVGVVAMRQHCSRSELAVGNLTPINF
jgi:hypothetical protein